MAEGGLSFKNAFKKFLNKTDYLEEPQYSKFSHEIDSNFKKELETSNKVIESIGKDTDNIAVKQMSCSKNLQNQSFQDSDKLMTEHCNKFSDLCVTKKENMRDCDFPPLPSLLVHTKGFINSKSEKSDYCVFFNKLDKCPKTLEVDNFLDHAFENVYNNDDNKHLFSSEDCDISVSFKENENYQNFKPRRILRLTEQTLILNKQEHQELEHHRKLFIGGFEDIDTEELYYYFLQFGKIERTINIRDYKAISKVIGYSIVFEKKESVKTIQTSAPHAFHNKTLKLYLPKNDGCEPEEFCKLYVGNLNAKITENDLANYFQRWGKIVDCVIKRKTETYISKYYGFVTFKLYKAMNDALVFPNHRIRCQNLKVDIYRERKQTLWGLDEFKHAYSAKFVFRKAKDSFSDAQKRDRKHYFSKTNELKKEILTERQMLKIIEQSKVFKPVEFKLNDFHGAGINVFKKTTLPKLKSSSLSCDSLSSDDGACRN